MLGHHGFLNALELSPGTEVYNQINTGEFRMGWSRAMANSKSGACLVLAALVFLLGSWVADG